MVLFYVGKLAWYPKGHLVSLGILPTNSENDQEVMFSARPTVINETESERFYLVD